MYDLFRFCMLNIVKEVIQVTLERIFRNDAGLIAAVLLGAYGNCCRFWLDLIEKHLLEVEFERIVT